VVVGSTGGIGERIAVRLVENGFSVCAIGRSRERLKEVKSCLEFANGGNLAFSLPPHPKITTARVDFNEWAGSGITAALLDIGRIDLLVLAHGASASPAAFDCINLQEFRRVLETDVWGSIVTCQEVVGRMKAQGSGSIVLLTSFHVSGTYPYRTVYNLAKNSISGLAKSLCCEYAKYGININAIAPGQVDGERSDAFVEAHWIESGRDLKKKWQRLAPACQIVDPEDIAHTVLWLTKAKSVNGQTIFLDHGVTASNYYDGY
jgi:gluconate 5-dehydrogenase